MTSPQSAGAAAHRERYDLARGELPADALAGLALPFDLGDLVRQGFNYCDRKGSVTLRTRFVARLARVAADVDETLVTHGALGALDLVLRAWHPAPRRFLCLSPTYREALTIARSHGLEPVEIPRHGDEVDVGFVRERARADDVVYLVPTLNNPDGFSLTAPARRALAEAVAASGARLVEDDAYGPLAGDFGRIPSVTGLLRQVCPERPAVRLASFSKILMPGARVCVVEGAAPVIAQLDAAKPDFGTSPLASAFVERVLDDGRCWDDLLATVRGRLSDGLAAAAKALDGWPLPVRQPAGGYFVWLPTGDVPPAEFRAATAAATGVEVAEGTPFFPAGPAAHHVRVSTSWESPARVAEACDAIHRTWAERIGGTQ